MMSLAIIVKLALALGLGAVIGLERESHRDRTGEEQALERLNIGGVRTFSLIGLLGAFAGVMTLASNNALATLIAATFFVMLAAYYVMGSILIKSIGMTTELSAAFTFLVGFIAVANYFPVQVLVALTIVLIFILSLKDRTKELVRGITSYEMHALIMFAVVALVILPFLPNQWYSLENISAFKELAVLHGGWYARLLGLQIVNPFQLWLVVVLITGVELVGHLLTKLVGERKGVALASIAGGLVSSTATTQILAHKSINAKDISPLLAAALFATAVSFPEVLVAIVLPLNPAWFVLVLPVVLLMMAAAAGIGIWFWRRDGSGLHQSGIVSSAVSDVQPVVATEEKLFEFIPAIKFALLVVLVGVAARFLFLVFGAPGFIIGVIIASFTGLDAITIVLAGMAGAAIPFSFALLSFIIANAGNLVAKFLYSLIWGKREFAYGFLWASIIVVAVSVVGYFIV